MTVTARPTTPVETLHPESGGAAVTLAEKLLAHLPEPGGVLVLGSISDHPGDAFVARQLALAIQLISSRPTLLLHVGTGAFAVGDKVTTPAPAGLVEVLAGQMTFERALVSPAGAGRLAEVPYGVRRPDATELFISEAFRGLLAEAQARYERIILYTPSLLGQRHAASLIARAKTVAVLVRPGHDGAGPVREVSELCTRLNRRFAGVILT